MKAIQIVNEDGPDSALALVELPEPEPSHMLTPGSGVLVEVHVAGVSFPELLQSRGQYQMKPPLPYVPGSEVGGVVISAPPEASVKPGDRVAAFCALGGWAETTVAPEYFTFALPDELDFAQGAALVLELPHGLLLPEDPRAPRRPARRFSSTAPPAASGTASLQVAKGLGATTIATVSTEEKRKVAEDAGADHVVMIADGWKDEVIELSGGGVEHGPRPGRRGPLPGQPALAAPRTAGWSSSGSPAARSPRSRSTGCC